MNEQHFAVFRQGPELVVDDEFEVVNVVTDFLYERRNCVVIGDGAFASVLYAVGHPSCFDESFHVLDDEGVVLSHLLDQAQIGAVQAVGRLGWEDGFHLVHIVDELRLVAGCDGYDVVHADVAEDASLDLYLLDVCVELDLVARLQFGLRQDVHALEHLHRFGLEVLVEDDGGAGLHIESAACRFLFPGLAVAVAVEADGLARLDVLAHDAEDGFHGLHAFADEGVDALLEVRQGLGHGGVEHNHRGGAVLLASDGTELEAVAREGEGRGAVAVRVVLRQLGYLRYVEAEGLLA